MSTVFERFITREIRGDVDLIEEPTVIRRRGHPYALGMLGFAVAAFVYGAYAAQWVPASTHVGVLGATLTFGALLPLLAGVLLFTALRGEGELAAAFSVLGAYWLYAFAADRLFTAGGVAATSVATFMGMTYVVFAVVMAYLAVSLWAKHPGAAVVTGGFGVSLIPLAIGQWASVTGWTIAGGYVMMAVALVGLAMAVLHQFPRLLRT